MKINRINLALTAFRKQCELGNATALFYNILTNEIWCSGESNFKDLKCGPEWKCITGISYQESWLCKLYLYGMSRRVIEEIVEDVRKEEV